MTDDMVLPPGHTAEAWNDAYRKVAAYLGALRVRNKFLLGQLVLRILRRALDRAHAEPDHLPTELATEEVVRYVNDWCHHVLGEDPADTPFRVSTRGRLSLLLADMPGKWQEFFLRDGPWPEDFVRAMKDGYLRAGPDFQVSQMEPREIHLGALHALTGLSRRPYLKMFIIWGMFALFLVVVFRLTH
ncbi:MAG: hypothetical protein WBE58_04375 [Verrucomicrobiales bacterium]